jgi:Calcineurin-like phosphoesterase
MRPALVAFSLSLCVAACGSDRERNKAQGPVITTAPLAPDKVLTLPKRPGSVRFAAIGDAGRGHQPQYEVAAAMAAFRKVFDFGFVVMLGDNVYDGGTPEDYRQKFELPYKPLLDDDVEFYAAIGNHDDVNQPSYAPFHMGGRRYYTFEPDVPLLAEVLRTRVRFFMLDTELLDKDQLAWLDRELGKSDAAWKIPAFHRPIYTSGRYSAPARIFRGALEPIFVRHGVRVALSGHEHFYERTTPQQGITYFISGAAGSLRPNDARFSPVTARAFDTDYSFMLFEISGDELFYQSISRTGHSVDSGSIKLPADSNRPASSSVKQGT